MKPSISTIPYGKSLDLRKRGMEAATFLVKNQGCVLGIDGIEYLKSSVRMTVSSPITDIYTRAADQGKLNCFTMFDLSRATDIPSVLTFHELAIDGKCISKEMPSDLKNVWVNLTPFIRRTDAYNRNLMVTDTVQFASMIARGMLCMSYNDSDAWLTPTLRQNIIDFYSMCYTMRLKTMFDLNTEEFSLVRLLFAAYMAQMLGSEEDKKDIPPILYSCRFLYADTGNQRTIDDRFASIAEARTEVAPNGELGIDQICKILAKVGPERMRKLLKATTFYQFMSRSPMDSQSMLVATDYPPYFVYLLLANLRGGKNPFFQSLLKFGDAKKKIVSFANELLTSKMFIDKVSR